MSDSLTDKLSHLDETNSGHRLRNPDGLEAIQEIARLTEKVEQLLQDRLDYSRVTTTEGLNASEWVWRTGKAEREVDRMRPVVEAAVAWYDSSGVDHLPLFHAIHNYRALDAPKAETVVPNAGTGEPCPTCKGEAALEQYNCPACHGTGRKE